MAEQQEHSHAYMHEHGIPHEHSHGHTHSHTQTRAVVNRLARAIGHLERVKAMVEEGRDCSEVLIQLAAVRSAILKDHLEHCITDAVEHRDSATIDELNRAIEQFVK